jgi:hypothetical protein
MEGKLFSLAEAEALLPTVAPLLTQLKEAIGAMREAEAQVSVLLHQHKEDGIDAPSNPDRARYWALMHAARAAEEKAQGMLDEVRFLGAEVKDVDLGLVDFRHQRGGEVVYLCWRVGEPRIGHWHDLKTGFAGRKPIEELEQPRPPG